MAIRKLLAQQGEGNALDSERRERELGMNFLIGYYHCTLLNIWTIACKAKSICLSLSHGHSLQHVSLYST